MYNKKINKVTVNFGDLQIFFTSKTIYYNFSDPKSIIIIPIFSFKNIYLTK